MRRHCTHRSDQTIVVVVVVVAQALQGGQMGRAVYNYRYIQWFITIYSMSTSITSSVTLSQPAEAAGDGSQFKVLLRLQPPRPTDLPQCYVIQLYPVVGEGAGGRIERGVFWQARNLSCTCI